MSRGGMATIITRVRELCELGTADYSVAGATYWTDDQVQSVLDQERTYLAGVALLPKGRPLDSDTEYKRYELPLDNCEGTAEGTAIFELVLSDGSDIPYDGTPPWTFDENDMAFVFGQDTEGTAYYWTGFTYNVNEACRMIWARKASHYFTAINFAADGARFDRKALHAHCLKMAEFFGDEQGMKVSEFQRSDLQAGSGDSDLF